MFAARRAPQEEQSPQGAMTAANHKRIEVAASPPCAEFRPRYFSKAAPQSRQMSPGDDRRSRITPIVVFILTAVFVAFATNLSMHLLNLRMQIGRAHV